MAIDPQIANPAGLQYAQNALIRRDNNQQQQFQNALAMRDQGLQERQFNTQQSALADQQNQAKSKMSAEQALAGARIIQQAAKQGQDPRQLIKVVAPDLETSFEQAHGPGTFAQLTPQQIIQMAQAVEQKSMAQLGLLPESISMEDQFKADQALKLKQAELTAAEKSRQQQQAFTAAENEKNRAVQTRGQDLTAQAAANRSNTTTAQSQAQNQRTLETYETAMAGLKQAMAATETGPLAGRIPAFTTEQQTAEGAVSAMAPILKQIFRVAGEGTFTDKDQELLLQMVPTRKDTPEARAAKIQNIDNIVKSKLGVTKTAGATGGWTVRKVQ